MGTTPYLPDPCNHVTITFLFYHFPILTLLFLYMFVSFVFISFFYILVSCNFLVWHGFGETPICQVTCFVFLEEKSIKTCLGRLQVVTPKYAVLFLAVSCFTYTHLSGNSIRKLHASL